MLNVAVIMGNLVADPELRQTPSGVAVTSFTVAVSRSFVKQGAERQSDFIDVIAWRHTAEFVTKYFKKGQTIALKGSIQTSTYEDKNGVKRKKFEIVADEVSFTGSKGNGGGTDASPTFQSAPFEISNPAPSFSSGSAGDFEVIDDGDELPF